MFDWRDYGNGIFAFDAGYVRPVLAAIHLIVEDGRVALIDTGSNDALPNALAALGRLGLTTAAVDHVILTHIHLDHAGGAGRMMAYFPNARLVVHPRGARHMADPARLVAGVIQVYGAEYVSRVYGEIVPIPPERIIEAPDGHVISLAGRELLCLDTPGHARHHNCIVDRRTGGTPTQFDPVAMHASIDRLLSFKPDSIYLTHYGRVGDIPKLGSDLRRRLDDIVGIAREVGGTGAERHSEIKRKLTEYLLAELNQHGCPLPVAHALDIWETDLELNAQGLEAWLDSLPKP